MKVTIELKLPEDAVFTDAYGAIEQATKMEILGAEAEPKLDIYITKPDEILLRDKLLEIKTNYKGIAFPDYEKTKRTWLLDNVYPLNPDCIGLRVTKPSDQWVFDGVMKEGWKPVETH